MTYNATTPNPAQSPGLFPPQNKANFDRLKTLINADHVFNNSEQANDGFHKQITFQVRTAAASGANPLLYSKLDASNVKQLNYWNGTSNQQITPVASFSNYIKAFVNFAGLGANGVNKTKRSNFNVTSVLKTGTGSYTINFSTPMPNTNYIVQLTGQCTESTNGVCNGSVDGRVPYESAVLTDKVLITFNGSGSDLRDVEMGCVTILSLT